MNQNFLLLYKDFTLVKKKGWIKSMRGGYTGIGYTFETLLNKKENRLCTPDYLDIEIKTMRYFSKKKIHLFNLTPNSEEASSIKEIVSVLGYPHRKFPQFKVFNVSVTSTEYTHLRYKNLTLKIDYLKERIELVAFNNYGENYNLNIYWSFNNLKKILYSKLQNLAVVKACSKIIDGHDYFYYNQISFYKLKDFDTFISLIEKGIIRINFKIGIYTDKSRFGRINDHGTDFSILEKDIKLLFDEVNIYE